jgi:serine/threonine-protein kinase
MGAVYLATHLRLERRAALKVLLPELAEDEGFRERFIRESQLAASLEHPNIVPVYDADEEDGVLYLAMRFIEGEDLGTILREQGALQPEFALDVIEEVASALDAAHASGLVHRDVKPANVLIARSPSHVYLTDFGVAKRMATLGMTRTGFFVGTVDYCAPEQIEGKEVDGRADVYALGGVLFHCLAGRRPYEKDSDVAVITAHLLEPPPAISTVQGHLSPAMDAVIRKAMAKQRDERYQTAGELAAAAREAIGGGAAAAAVPTLPSPSPAATVAASDGAAVASTAAPATEPSAPPATEPSALSATVPPQPAPETAEHRRRVSRKALVVGGAIVLVAVVGALLGVLLTRSSPSRSSSPPTTAPVGTSGPIVPTSARPWLATAGGSLYVTSPSGTVAQLDPTSLATVSSLPDPARPRSMVASGDRIVTADDRSVTAYRTPRFAPVGAADFGSRPMLAAGAASAPIAVARGTGGDGGRICIVHATSTDPSTMLDPCVSTLGFVPAGLGVASGGRVLVSDASGGKVQLLTVRNGELVAGNEHDVGAQPAGRMIASGSHLFVPVAHGVAVVDLASGTLQRTIALPARPSDLWITSAGRLFAALPSRSEVAVVAVAGGKPFVVKVPNAATGLGGGRLPSGGEAVYAADAKGHVARLDPTTGKVLTSRTVGALQAKTPPALKVDDVTFTSSGRTVSAVIHLSGGSLPAASLVTKDARIKLGTAALALWQGGITTRVGAKRGSGLAIRLQPRSGRLLVSATAKPGAFAHLDVHLGPGGRSVVLAFTKVPATPKPTSPPPPPPQSVPVAPPPPPPPPPPAPQPPPPPTIG